MQNIDIERQFNSPINVVYDWFNNHDNLNALFAPAKVTRIRDGKDNVNGVGSVRRLKIPGVPAFEETVTDAVVNDYIAYRITRGSPLNHHAGRMTFTEQGDKTQLNYHIEFSSRIPLLAGLVKVLLERSINKGLDKLQLSL